MSKPLPAVLTLLIALSLPLPARAQADAVEEPESQPTATVEDTRAEDLRALVPRDLAGLPLREALQLALGEELAGRMEDEERAVFEAMLASAGKGFDDYVAASAVIRLNETDALVIQPHRVVGIDAQGTLPAWLEIFRLNTQRPRVALETIGGRDVYLVTDDAQPAFPRLHVFAAGDVVWMVAVEDDDVAAEAVRRLSEASLQAGSAE